MKESKDYYYVQADFPNKESLEQFKEDLEEFRERLKSSNPGFTIMVRSKYRKPRWATPHYFNGHVSLMGGQRTEKVVEDFQEVKKIFEKHGVKSIF